MHHPSLQHHIVLLEGGHLYDLLTHDLFHFGSEKS